MPSLAVRILLPGTSWRGRKVREVVLKVRRRRAINYSRAAYNGVRDKYYRHFTALTVEDSNNKISIVVPCFNTPDKYFEPLLSSVLAQGYENWELVLVDASSDIKRADHIEKRSRADDRIVYVKTKNEGIAINTNVGLAAASGRLIAFLDHDDTLDPNALAENAALFSRRPELGLVYSDEDKVTDDGERYFEPHFKPGFSLDMLRNVNYITHFVVVRKEIVDKIGGIRKGFDGAQDFDFLLRVVDTGVQVGHIPKILYHWREADGSTAANFSNKRHITQAGCKALEDHYTRRGIKRVKEVRAIVNRPGFYRTYYKNPNDKLKVVIDLSDTGLLPIEKNFIIDSYVKSKDIIKNKIDVVESSDMTPSPTTMVIKGAIIPSNDHTDFLSMFMLAQEEGVGGVMPKVVRHGRIFDMGYVEIRNEKIRLFRDLNPNKFRGFGSMEWVRNVDELSRRVQVGSLTGAGRRIVWSHSEFIALETEADKVRQVTGDEFYNLNVLEVSELFESSSDYVSDLVETPK